MQYGPFERLQNNSPSLEELEEGPFPPANGEEKKLSPEQSLGPEFEAAFEAERSALKQFMGKPKPRSPLAEFLRKQLTTADRSAVLRMLNCALNDPARAAGVDWTEVADILNQWLEQNPASDETISLILVCISKLPLSREIIRRTMLGKTLSQVVTHSQAKRVQSKAENIITQWKRNFGDFEEFPGKSRPLSELPSDSYQTKRKKYEQPQSKYPPSYNRTTKIRPIIKTPYSRDNNKPYKKKVQWMPEEKLVSVKRFRLEDTPNSKEPPREEGEKPSKPTAVPKRFQESRIKELRMEKAAMGKIREKDNYMRKRLEEMQPDKEWVQPVELFAEPREEVKSVEKEKQKQREGHSFAVHYIKEHLIPPYPQEIDVKEFSEIEACKFEPKLAKSFEEKRVPPPEPDLDKSLALGLFQALVRAGPEVPQWRPPSEPAARPLNYKTVPCKMYHGPGGHCTKGEFCHFIHDPNFAGREIPLELWRGPRRPVYGQRFPPPMHRALPGYHPVYRPPPPPMPRPSVPFYPGRYPMQYPPRTTNGSNGYYGFQH